MTRVACDLLSGEAPPRLLLLHLSQTAAALAAAPPGSPGVRRAVAGADAEVGRLLACLRRSGRLAGTALVVTGDHGAMPVHTAIRPNAKLVEVGLLTVDPRGVPVRWDAFARSNGGSAFVYAGDEAQALLARRALEEAAAESGGAFRVASARELVDRGADPQAWFGLDARPGWVFADAVSPPLAVPAPTASAGGYGSLEPRMATGLVAWGPGVRAGVRVPELRQIDIAPTLARWLSLSLEGAEGRVLVGLVGGTAGPATSAAPAVGQGARP
jgi:arylsulfatase A-like enzyme